MKKTHRIPIAAIAVFLLGILATNSVVASSSVQQSFVQADDTCLSIRETNIIRKLAVTSLRFSEEAKVGLVDSVTIHQPIPETDSALNSDPFLPTEEPDEVKKLRKALPKDPEEAEEKIASSRNRFLMWTSNLRHIMWGHYGNRFFVGTDNLGKRAWGIYGKGFFAGFYDGEFFWGKYHRGLWAARGLFGEKHARGKYVVSPAIALRPIAEARLHVSPVSTANSITPVRSISISRASPATTVSTEPSSTVVPDEVEKLRRLIPEDLKKAESQVRPLTNRYLLWTHNLKHIMWGYYRNGFFVGTDNHGKRSFGIYGNGFFAGFYGEEFFWGRYRSGYWRAENLF